MLHHLPVRYRVAVWVAGLVAFAGCGAWLTVVTRVSLEWRLGAAIGLALGALATTSFLRALERPGSARPDPDGAGQVA